MPSLSETSLTSARSERDTPRRTYLYTSPSAERRRCVDLNPVAGNSKRSDRPRPLHAARLIADLVFRARKNPHRSRLPDHYEERDSKRGYGLKYGEPSTVVLQPISTPSLSLGRSPRLLPGDASVEGDEEDHRSNFATK